MGSSGSKSYSRNYFFSRVCCLFGWQQISVLYPPPPTAVSPKPRRNGLKTNRVQPGPWRPPPTHHPGCPQAKTKPARPRPLIIGCTVGFNIGFILGLSIGFTIGFTIGCYIGCAIGLRIGFEIEFAIGSDIINTAKRERRINTHTHMAL